MGKTKKLASNLKQNAERINFLASYQIYKIVLIRFLFISNLSSVNMCNIDEQFPHKGIEFTWDLLNQFSLEGLNDNVIFSPFSIQSCLALAFAGAKGETANEIARVMKYNSNVQSEVANAFKFVLDKYKSSPLLKIANKIYVRVDRKIKDSYQQALKEHYFAEAEAINFVDNVNAANSINSWVESKTNNKIKDLISPGDLDESTRLVLFNALHFKGDWKSKFNKDRTIEDDFWLNETKSISIPFMLQRNEFKFGQISDLDCKALEMPYKDSDLSMLVLLPNKRSGLKTLVEKLKTNNLMDLMASKMHPINIIVKFPKFKIDFSMELSKTLKALGLMKMFGSSADFSNMVESAENIAASKVIHKAFIEVNEDGTEATASTGMVVMMRSLIMEFYADHPFLYIIWNTQNILFAGVFVNATKE